MNDVNYTPPFSESQALFVDTVVRLTTGSQLDLQDAIVGAQKVFEKAGIMLPASSVRLYEPQGLVPPRGVHVLLPERWDPDSMTWVPTVDWSEASRLAKVTSKKALTGRAGLLCFNVRASQNPRHTRFQFAVQRLYLEDEGLAWRWSK